MVEWEADVVRAIHIVTAGGLEGAAAESGICGNYRFLSITVRRIPLILVE